MSLPLSEDTRVRPPQSRAGNAMQRGRDRILEAAALLVADGGLSALTMAGVARQSGVAKATVYNHVRDRDELVAALATEQWRQLQHDCSRQPQAERLTAAASWISGSPVLEGLRAHNPEVLPWLGAHALSDPRVTDVVATWIPVGRDTESALRWLLSFVVAPAPR